MRNVLGLIAIAIATPALAAPVPATPGKGDSFFSGATAHFE